MMKGEILKVGYVDDNNQPQQWHFDCNNEVAALTYTEDGILWAGYSVEELRRISETVS